MAKIKAFTLVFLVSLAAALSLVKGEEGSTLEVVKSPDGKSMNIQRKPKPGEKATAFTSVECLANPGDYEVTCYPIELPSGKFLLVDCFGHDAVCQSCRLVRFNANGTQDNLFRNPFGSSLEELMRSAESEIKRIDAIKVEEDGSICIKGAFISPLINWTQQDAYTEREESGELGDVLGKSGLLCLEKNGLFKSFSASSNKQNGALK